MLQQKHIEGSTTPQKKKESLSLGNSEEAP